MSRAALLLLFLAVGAQAGDGEEPLPGAESVGPGEIPAIDVEANVRKMLEASRASQPGPVSSPPVSPAAASPAPPITPGKGPTSPGPEPEDYVPLPQGTITVRSLGDVERVDRELKEARKRSGPAPAGKVPPAQHQ